MGEQYYLQKNIFFNQKANVSPYDSWERESPGITICYPVNHSWEFHTEDRGERGRMHRHIP